MEPPERRQLRWRKEVPERIGSSTEDRARLIDLVAKEPGFGQRAAKRDFIFAFEPGRSEGQRENLGRFGALPAFELRTRAPVPAERRYWPRREYTTERAVG